MEIKAQARYLRISPRKVKLIVDLIRGMMVIEAESQLQFLNKRAARIVLKLLNSALANAKHNFNLVKENLYIKEIVANQGPALKRWMPKAYGRAAPIKKRSTHLAIVLEELKSTPALKISKREPLRVSETESQTDEVKEKEVREVISAKPRLQSSFLRERERGNKWDRRLKQASGFMKKIFIRKSG